MSRGAWIILRTAGRSTLSLAQSLVDHGFEAWTPTQTRTIRAPRSKAQTEKPVPLMPTFVFARAEHLTDLASLADVTLKDHPDFSVFRYCGRYPAVSDAALEPLRSEEIKTVPKHKRIPFEGGDRVRIPEGIFGGMSGIIEMDDGQYALVTFPGSRMPVKISAFLLRADNAYTSAVHLDTAAQAA